MLVRKKKRKKKRRAKRYRRGKRGRKCDKLNAALVTAIRESKLPQKCLALDFAVSVSTISRVLTRKCWKNV